MNRPYLNKTKSPAGKLYFSFRRATTRGPLPGQPGEAEFEAAYAAMLATSERALLAGQGVPRASTIAGLIDAYLAGPSFAALKPVTQGNVRAVLNRLGKLIGHHLYERFTAHDLRALMRQHAAKPTIANQFLKSLRVVWRDAVDAGLVDPQLREPWQGVRLLRTGKPRRPVWNDTYHAAYCNRWPEGTPQHVAAVVGYETALRRIDLVRLTRDHVRDGVIVLQLTKTDRTTGTVVRIPVSRALAAVLATLPAEQHHLIVNAKGKPYRREDSFSRDLKTWFRTAGVGSMSTHAFRRGAATRLINLGASVAEVAAVGGWSSVSELEKYIGSRSTDLLARTAVDRVNAAARATDLAAKSTAKSGIADLGEVPKTLIAHAFKAFLADNSRIPAGKGAP